MESTQAGAVDCSCPGYLFSVFRLERDGALFCGETFVALPPLELKALRLLLAHSGKIVSPAQLRQALWGEERVAATELSACLASLREHLEPHVSIETVYKRGYRLSAEARPQEAGSISAVYRLAILPFSTEYGVPEYVGPAVAEETSALLTGIRQAVVQVLALDSSFSLARKGLAPKEIGKLLGADMVLTGCVRALPRHYRLEATMIRCSDGGQLWVEHLLVDRGRMGSLERELADRVMFRLQEGEVWISAEAAKDEGEAVLTRREAREIYKQAHHEWQCVQRHHMQDAMCHLSRAIELDPSLLAARLDMANLSIAQGMYGFMAPTSVASIVKHAAMPRREGEPIPEAILPALGWVKMHVDRDLAAAREAFSRSSHLPHNLWVTGNRSMFALSRHRTEEAIEIFRAALSLDPWSPWLLARLSWALHLAGEGAESVRQIREALEQFPGHLGVGFYAALILGYNGEAEQAIELTSELALRATYSDMASAAQAYLYAMSGREAEARIHLERLQWLGQERYVVQSFTAAAYVALGEYSAALEQLKAAETARCPWFFQMLIDPRLKALQAYPEFQAMQRILPEMEAAAVLEAERA